MSASELKSVGFDRKIQLDWLDATAEAVAQGVPVPALRSRLEEVLEGNVSGEGAHSARGKTITVLLHVWARVPQSLVPLRDDGLALFQDRSGRKRLPLHWGMCVATYPFFRDVASTIGRLVGLQGTVALSQVTRRMSESWGARSTVTRATQRVVRSLVQWKALEETEDRGVFSVAPKMRVRPGDPIGQWVIEAALSNSGRRTYPLRGLVTSAAFFPFELHLSPRDVAGNARLEVHHQGFDDDVVTLRKQTT